MRDDMQHVYNQSRFNQQSDFSHVALWGSDIDFFSEVADKAYIKVEWKCLGQSLPWGQELGFKRFVHDMGQVKPTFSVIAEHSTDPSEFINGDNSYVRAVRYRLPNMHKSDEYLYMETRPTLNQWLSDFTLEFRIADRMLRGVPQFWEGWSVPLCTKEDSLSYDFIEDIPKSTAPSEFFDYIRPVTEAHLNA